MESGHVVEFIDSQRIFCAVVIDIKKMRLRLLTENNREVKLSAGRLAHKSDLRLDPSMGRDKLVTALKEISARRRELSGQVDIQGLWDVLHSEQQWIDLGTMTGLCFPDLPDGDCQSAVLRAFFNDRLYFKFSPEQFFPRTAEKVEQIVAQRKAEVEQAKLIDQGAAWLQSVLKGKLGPPPERQKTIVKILSSYFLFEKESPHRETAKAILKKAATGSLQSVFSFLVKIGIWHSNENLDLLRYGINAAMPAPVEARAVAVCQSPPALSSDRRDLRSLPLMTIDGPSTLDFDDALSIAPQGDQFLVGIHIADVGHYVTREDDIDQEAIARASSIYMPDLKLSMLPDVLAQGACSLKAGEPRPAISTLLTVTAQAKIVAVEIVPSLIQVHHQLTYQDVDMMADEDWAIKMLRTIALNYRSRRLDNGALQIDLPEINVWLNANGEPMISRMDRESPGRLLVSELMILANDQTARYLAKNNLPAIFRSQPEPRERLFPRDQGTMFQNWMQRKQISRFVLGSAPEPHAGLGLPAYVTATSPIRKYSDLVTQRQVRAALGLEKPYDQKEIDYLIAALEEPMGQVGRVQFRRHRYWLLKYLEGRIGTKEEAVVLNKRRDGYAILLTNYMIECHLSGAENVKLKPEDLVQVTIQHASARNDLLTVYLG